MEGLSANFVSPALLGQTPEVSAAELAQRANIGKTAQDFESSFLSIMLQQMFEGVETSAPFGGGPGEAMFKSFMTDAFAKQMAKAGGVGVADAVQREMLKLQGLE
jgi:flagellar protein FlgJ